MKLAAAQAIVKLTRRERARPRPARPGRPPRGRHGRRRGGTGRGARPARPRPAGALAAMTPHDHAHVPDDDHEAGAHFHPDSLNPALEGLRFCPRCGAAAADRLPALAALRAAAATRRSTTPSRSPAPSRASRTAASGCCAAASTRAPGCGRSPAASSTSASRSRTPRAARRTRSSRSTSRSTGLVGVYSRPQDRVVLVVYDATLHGRAARDAGGDRGPRLRARRAAVGRARVLVDASRRCATCSARA